MSVLLTAGRKINKCKSAKPKKKKSKSKITFCPVPPESTDKTLVWYWELDCVPTTVMFTKETAEVWCNGAVLDTIDGFADDDSDGGVIDFCIYNEESDVNHKARIKRVLADAKKEGFAYQLLVDGYMIMEHRGGDPLPMPTEATYCEEEDQLGACALANGEDKKDV